MEAGGRRVGCQVLGPAREPGPAPRQAQGSVAVRPRPTSSAPMRTPHSPPPAPATKTRRYRTRRRIAAGRDQALGLGPHLADAEGCPVAHRVEGVKWQRQVSDHRQRATTSSRGLPFACWMRQPTRRRSPWTRGSSRRACRWKRRNKPSSCSRHLPVRSWWCATFLGFASAVLCSARKWGPRTR